MTTKTIPRIITVDSLVKRYVKASVNAVDNVSFYVEEGAFFSLLGPNGAGKTTIISILTTLLRPTSGTVSLAGFDMDKDQNEVRRQIGVIFQKPSLDTNLTAEENIRFHANLYGLYPYRPSISSMPEGYQKRVSTLADVVGLSDKDLKTPVKALSGGMKRKLEIIRSLMHHPKVLFLDEPTTGLDPVSRKSLWQYLHKVQKEEKTTVFLTTHYLEEAEGADYVCIIDKGKIISKGTPREIKESLTVPSLIIDSKDNAKLLTSLKSLNLSFTGKGPYHISSSKISFQEIISRIPEKLSLLDIHNPTLEDAYLEIIKNNENV